MGFYLFVQNVFPLPFIDREQKIYLSWNLFSPSGIDFMPEIWSARFFSPIFLPVFMLEKSHIVVLMPGRSGV